MRPATPERAATSRLFFALWPPPDAQRALGTLAVRLARACGGRAVPAERIHLTLAFLGATSNARVPSLQAAVAGIGAEPFELQLDCLGFWRRKGIVWAGASRCPQALTRLVEALGARLEAEGCPRDARPFAPHLTLVRNARRAPRERVLEPLDWPVSRFALVVSRPGASGPVYETLRAWPLVA